jgi:D-glycero-beta-D-manno-heptose 1-phosphate adenylyltransferase
VIANGGEVKTIPLVAGYSTTRLIEKIKNAY